MARILVAEDDPDIASLLELYLQRAGFEAELVATGRDVLPRIKKAPPDLLLLDLMLPGVDGLEICRGVRGDRPRQSSAPRRSIGRVDLSTQAKSLKNQCSSRAPGMARCLD